MEKVGFLGVGGGDYLAIGEHHLDPVDRLLKKPMSEGAAFAGRTREAATNSDTWKFHHNWRHQAILKSYFDKAVHGHVWLYQGSLSIGVNLEDIREAASVYYCIAPKLGLACAVRRAMVDAERRLQVTELANASCDDRYFVLMDVHQVSAECQETVGNGRRVANIDVLGRH